MRKTIKSLEAELSALTAEKNGCSVTILKLRERADSAERVRDQVVKDNADLKERLHNSETKVARLEGYMDRVREDDAVSDPLVEVEGPEGKRMVSKRHPTPFYRNETHDFMSDHLMSREKQRHWTSY